MKKTDKKVKVTNGRKEYIRVVYESEEKDLYFKDSNEWNRIYFDDNKKIHAPYYTYIEFFEGEAK